jgi:dTDP-4-amino-4,6-dideoxygalactose transaminase
MSPVTKGPERDDIARRPVFFYGSAREGMRDFLANTAPATRRGILLPGYIGWSPREGSGVFDPVKSLGLDAAFYGLTDGLSVDLEEMTELAETGQFGVVVVIHYYGRAEPQTGRIRELADKFGMVLVEDLAHAFFGAWTTRSVGLHGDVNLYSLHKMFPLPKGGMVTYASSQHVTAQRSTMPELAADVLSFDWPLIARRRRELFDALTGRLHRLPEHGDLFTLLWPTLNSTDVPQSLPVHITGESRDEIYSTMNSQGYGLVSLYHTLIEEATHPSLLRLSRHIINFPCHQDVDMADLDGMVEAFRRSLRRS